MKQNCWEFKECGRQAGGKNVGEFGVCPAAVDDRLDGTHGGINGGRACWVLAGTMCGGQVQGTFAKKFENCSSCEFFTEVRKEEGVELVMSITLLNRLKAFEVKR